MTIPLLPTPHMIRPATSADADEIVRITNRAYQAEAFCIVGDRTDHADINSKYASGQFLVIDGEKTGTLIGSVFCEIVGGRGYLGMLAVDPDAQGGGLSRLLVAAVEARCRDAGCNFLDLTVINVRENLFPFYAKFGFAPCEVVAFPAPEVVRLPLHLVRMTKALHPPGKLWPPATGAA